MDTEDLTIEGLVHDLNNVFQTIGEAAELLESDPQWRKLAGTLERSVDRGRRIVWSIMETSRSQAELGPVVESAIAFAQDYLECVHAPSVEFAYDSGQPADCRTCRGVGARAGESVAQCRTGGRATS
jgi:hypothetical protein